MPPKPSQASDTKGTRFSSLMFFFSPLEIEAYLEDATEHLQNKVLEVFYSPRFTHFLRDAYTHSC
jgi:hypothetical protein